MRLLSAIVFCTAALWAVPSHICANPALAGISANPAPAGPGAPVLGQPDFTATGTHETILTIPSFGRYTISVASTQGTALQLVDRMAGPGGIQGLPGQSDGRIDTFLERGSYKIRLISDAHGTGKAVLTITPFAELQPAPLQLVQNKPVLAALGDEQQLSWWIQVPARGTYSFEAGGRYLADLRLWQDGGWMVNATPAAGESDANPDQPLGLQQLTAQLEPGLYRLTAYGGVGLPWASGAKDQPFMLRWGVPSLSDAGRTTHTESLLGIDRFLVPSTVSELRLVIGHPETAQISAQPYAPETMFQPDQDNVATIDKTSRDPVAELSLSTQGGTTPWLVTVNYKPGGSYRLEALNTSGGSTTINGSDSFISHSLLAVTLPGNPDDEIDPGFMLIDDQQKLVASQVIELDTALPWRRHFNLLRPEQTILHTTKNVDLQVDGNGATAQFVVDRFMTQVPDDHVVPLPKPSGGVWTLTPGYYVLSAIPQPNGLGVLTMSLHAKGTPAATADSPRLAAAFFSALTITQQHPDTLYNSLDGTEDFGLRQETLPAALAQPLSLELAQGGSENFPITVAENSQLTVAGADGKPVAFTLDGKPATSPATLSEAKYQLGLTGPGPGAKLLTIALTPITLLAATPLPSMPEADMSQPVLPPVLPGQPRFVDLAQSQSLNFALPVDHDALYQFQTTGLLETGGTIRTRTNPALAQAEGNGTGRNFLLAPYLREGDYQLSVEAQGTTAGHTGVAVTQTPLLDEGLLTPNLPARMTLEPGTAALYHFHISAPGSYHLFTLGLGHQFTMRLEDADGWPLIAPGGPADTTMDFLPGDYRMILLPGTVENRAVTMLQPVPPPVSYSGHGPFAASFSLDMENRWMEPAPGQPRSPDVWNFSLPAPATVTLAIDSRMLAQVYGPTGTALGTTTAGNWSGKLPAGDYHLDASSVIPNNRLDYTLNIGLTELLPGQSEAVSAPATIPLSLGGAQQYEISSFGAQDVRAALYDAAGKLVAQNDDRANDWNFLIAGSFAPGAYTLRVEPVGADSAETTVAITSPVTAEGPALQPGVTAQLTDGLVHVMPVPTLAPGELLLAGATSPVPVGLALEMQDGAGAWRTLAGTSGINPYLAVPTGAPAQKYRLRAWPADHGDTPIAITVAGAAAGSETDMLGASLQPINLGARQLGMVHAAIAQPGLFQLTAPDDTLQWSTLANVPAAHESSGTIAAGGNFVWLVDSAPHALALAAANPAAGPVRLSLPAGQTLALPVSQSSIALWQALGQGAQPGIMLTDGTATTMPQAMALGGKTGMLTTSFAFQPAGMAQPALHLWQVTPAGDALPLSIQRIAFPAPAVLALQIGSNDSALAPGAALQAPLLPGWKRLTLNLPTGVVAILLSSGRPQGMIAGNGAIPDVLETQAEQILLLNPGTAAAPLSLILTPEDHPSLVLAPGGILTNYSATPAILHVTIGEAPAARLRIGGSATDICALGADGNVTSGHAAQGGAGSIALVTVQPGLAILSSDAPVALAGLAQKVNGPGSIPLTGTHMLLGVSPGPAQVVSFSTTTPIVLRDQNSGVAALYPAGAVVNLFQPKSKNLLLDILPVGSGGLSGSASFAMQSAIPITDGIGPKFFTGPGQARLFTFSLSRKQAIGAGVHGSVDDASLRLLAVDGTELGRGVVSMSNLDPGTYFLLAEVPPDAAASALQPALVGLTLPDDGPPPEVQNSYRALAAPQN